jgi:hypothetical protein
MIAVSSKEHFVDGKRFLSRCGKTIGQDISDKDIPTGWIQLKASSYGGNEYISINPSCVCGVVGSENGTKILVSGCGSFQIDQSVEDVLAALMSAKTSLKD